MDIILCSHFFFIVQIRHNENLVSLWTGIWISPHHLLYQ